ncbi:MAG: 1-acyl-sn-glycerol-3-phosphate acyltransferase [Candidatus Obscuribacterales bacterium]|nr:1-acyl-sn-glycerol-3-phosphate acyltransferase [Cyanobacteria bacterium SZAS LIN-5]
MDEFIQPIDDPFAVSVAKMLLPLAKWQNGLDIQISDECKERIRSLRQSHAVLMINHSDRFDPLCACALSNECNESFNFIASREQFDRMHGIAGWVLQHLGAYSVIRGSRVERASAEETVKILVQGKHKLAQFPEGDVTGRDDAILPLKEDGLHNLFEAQRQLLELTGESLFVLPVAFYYKVRHDSIKPMTDSINRLERALALSSLNTLNLTFEQRIKRLVSEYISHIARTYNLALCQKHSLSAELRELSRKIALATAQSCGLTHPSESEDDAVLLYDVRAALRKAPVSESLSASDYEIKLHNSVTSKCAVLTKDLDLAEQLLILASTMQSGTFSPQTAWRVLDRLELQVIGKTTAKGHRTALIQAANAIDLVPFFHQYKIAEDVGLKSIDRQVRQSLLDLMDGMQADEKLALYA